MAQTRYEVRKARLTGIDLISDCWDDPVEMLATDVSPAGLFVPSDLLLEPGNPVVACFRLPGHRQEFQIFCEVAWAHMPRRAGDLGIPGMGVRFVRTSPLERLTIRESLRLHAPASPRTIIATHAGPRAPW